MVVVDEGDIAIMLLHHWHGDMSDINYNSEILHRACGIESSCFN